VTRAAMSLQRGFSSGQGIAAMEKLADKVLPSGFGFEWTEIALQEKLAGNTAVLAFGLAVVFVFLLLALIIPYQALITPVFFMFASLKLTNTLVGLAIIHTAIQIPFSVYLMRNSFEAVPKELEEAAVIDGCSSWQVLTRIYVPAIRPAIVTVSLFAFITSWNEFLAALREDPAIDWTKVTAFHLDEYLGIGVDHPASFRRFLRDRLFDHVPVRAFHGLDGEAKDPSTECARYSGLLRAASPVLAILGIGENGHLAFIDPPVCDFFEPKDVRVVDLDEVCRQQQVNDGSFARLEDVPRRALSLGIPLLLEVPRAVAIVPGTAKRAAIAAAVVVM